MDISFTTTRPERRAIEGLARRAAGMDVAANGLNARQILDWTMDFTAVHANGCPLDLERLAKADDFNFAHDAFGIARHLNRTTGQLENCFLPRFARRCQDTVRSDPPAVRKIIAEKRERFENRKAR